MEDFFNDFKDFINTRLQQPLFDIENDMEYKEKINNYKLYYNILTNKLNKESITSLEKLIIEKEKIEDLYIDMAYQTGFIDGITIYNSIKKESKK